MPLFYCDVGFLFMFETDDRNLDDTAAYGPQKHLKMESK